MKLGYKLKLAESLHKKIREFVKVIQRYTNRAWYPQFIGLLAIIDSYVIVIPNDGILISSSMLTPKRWFSLAVCISVGSTIGAVTLVALVEKMGLPWILELFSGIDSTQTWAITQRLFDDYGLALVFAVAITPLFQHPAIILAGLTNTPLMEFAAVTFAGRILKYLFMAYLSSHAPQVLSRLWGLQSEMRDVGIENK